jgi:phage terminase large subunit-like protein
MRSRPTSPKSRQPKDPVTTYARRVVDRQIIAGPYVRAACQRHLNDLENGHERGLAFDLRASLLAREFYPDFLTVEFDGTIIPFNLMDWAAFCVGSVFGWKHAATGYRRFTRAYIETAKGSGKTPLLGGIGLYMFLFDNEQGAQVFAAGSRREQSMIMFRDVMQMVDRSPRLRLFHLRKTGKNPGSQLTHMKSASFFKPIASDKTKSGPRVSCGLVDELHEHHDRYTIDMLKAGFKGRKQPLLAVATNAGFDRESICWEWHEHACAVVEGLRDDDELFAFVMSLDDGDDPLEDERCWEKTNPGIDITVTRAYLRSQVSEARQIPGRESSVRRLNFCEWTDAETTWMTRNAWVSNEDPTIGMPDSGKVVSPIFAPHPEYGPAECYLGLDLSFAFDLTALAFAFPDGKNLTCWIEYFTPQETAAEREKKDRVPYVAWIRDGLVHGVPGKIVRKEYIASRIADVLSTYDVRWAAYDRYRHKELESEMAEIGIDAPWIEHPQGFRRGGQLELVDQNGDKLDNPLWMPSSIDLLETRIIEHTIKVMPSPVTRWQVSSVVIRPDPAGTGNRVFNKAKSVGRIDGIVALAEAVGVAEMRLPVRDFSQFLARPVMAR